MLFRSGFLYIHSIRTFVFSRGQAIIRSPARLIKNDIEEGIGMNNKKTLHRLFEFAESCKGLLTGSVVFAVLGAGFGIIPYIAVSRIIIQICSGDYS